VDGGGLGRLKSGEKVLKFGLDKLQRPINPRQGPRASRPRRGFHIVAIDFDTLGPAIVEYG
jgi:hypothetical protein